MSKALTAGELLWNKQQQAEKLRRRTEQRAWMKAILLAFGLIVVTIALATMLARTFGASGR